MLLNICIRKSLARGGLSLCWALGGHGKVYNQEEFEQGSLHM